MKSLDRALAAAFCLSGAAALVLETLWFRGASLAVGSTTWASSLVLASFMAGLALGGWIGARLAARLTRPLLVYAGLEVAIAAAGLGAVLALPRLAGPLASWYRALADGPGQDALRVAVAFLVLLVPATAMGATLPVLTRALVARDPRAGVVIGRLYGWNTLGAVVGALLPEVWSIGALGVRGSALLACALDLAAAAIAVLVARRLAALPAPVEAAAAAPARAPLGPAAPLLVVAALVGATMLALEVVWMRVVLLRVYGTSLAFAVVVSVVLAGIAAGGLVGAAWLRRRPDAHRHAATVAALAGLALSLAYLSDPTATLVARAATMALPIAPVALASGLLFTLLAAALGERLGDGARAAGLLAASNTLGGIAGALLAGFVLLPRIGPERGLFALVLLWGLLAAALLRRDRGAARWAPLAALALYAAALAAFPHGRWEGRLRLAPPPSRVVAVRDGLNETIRYVQAELFGQPSSVRLITNSHAMAGTDDQSRRYMKLFAWWPAAVLPRVERALLISFGCGTTARALCDLPELARLDVVDVSRDVLELSRIPHPVSDPLDDPRVRVHVEDGRFFLQTTDERWDLITGEPPPPAGAGVANLYTREHFELIRDRLSEGGVCTWWLPVHGLSLRESQAITRAFLEAFPDASLWQGSGLDLMLVGGRGPIARVDDARFGALWRRPDLAAELEALGLDAPERLGATFLASAEGLPELIGDTPALTDDRPDLSDALGPDQEALYAPWLDPDRARARFERSPYVAERWPPAVRASTLRDFDLHRAFALTHAELRLAELHAVVTRGGPRLLALRVFGSSVDGQRCLARALALGLPRTPFGEWHLAAGAIADRRYAEAAAHLGRATEAPDELRAPLLAWTLCMAGDLAGARAVPRAGSPGPWAFLDATFDLGGR